MRFITSLSLLCVSGMLVLGQQPAAPTPAPAKPQPQTQNQPAQPPAQTSPAPAQSTASPVSQVDKEREKYDFESQASIEFVYWLTKGSAQLIGGEKSFAQLAGGGNLPLEDIHKTTPGVVLKFPAGKFNRLEISYFQGNGSGNSVAPETLTVFNTTVPAGDYLATNFRLRMLKISWNYLTWPSPPEESKFRVKTMWGFQYDALYASVDAPFELSALFAPSFGTRTIYYPDLGIGAEYVPSHHLYFQAQASGFALPHRAVVWDADASAVVRFWRHGEVFAGVKMFHMKSSPKADAYAEATIKGPYAGLRWVF